jgi:hypothetical protein
MNCLNYNSDASNHILLHVFEYLSNIQVIKLKSVSKHLHFITDFYIKHEFNKTFKDLLPLLKIKGSVLSGSSVLQFLLKEKYSNYDYDIFTNEIYLEQIFLYLEKQQYNKKRLCSQDNSLAKAIHRLYDYFDVYEFTKKNHVKIQVIVIHGPIFSFIASFFDLSIVKNYIDLSNNNFVLKINDINGIDKKISKFYHRKEQMVFHEEARVRKYVDRGFQIDKTDNGMFEDKHYKYFEDTCDKNSAEYVFDLNTVRPNVINGFRYHYYTSHIKNFKWDIYDELQD